MQSIKILLIEGDDKHQFRFVDALKGISQRFLCEVAANGKKGFDYLDKSPAPDVIFLELDLPGMGGIEFIYNIKKHLQFMNIPIVVFTTSLCPEDKKKSLGLGASVYLNKPTIPQDYAKMIQKAFSALHLHVN